MATTIRASALGRERSKLTGIAALYPKFTHRR
jgi:hypothetical protein